MAEALLRKLREVWKVRDEAAWVASGGELVHPAQPVESCIETGEPETRGTQSNSDHWLAGGADRGMVGCIFIH